MKTSIILKKKRLNYRAMDAMQLINRGNHKLIDTLAVLGPALTSDELNQIYKKMHQIMQLQCQAYRVLLSEKEEKWK